MRYLTTPNSINLNNSAIEELSAIPSTNLFEGRIFKVGSNIYIVRGGVVTPIEFIKFFDFLLTSPVSSINIPVPSNIRRNIIINHRLRSTQASSVTNLQITFNNDTGANYRWARKTASSDATLIAAGSNSDTNGKLCQIPGATSLANFYAKGQIYIPRYEDGFLKSYYHQGVVRTGVGNIHNQDVAGYWENTTPIISIQLFVDSGNFEVNSHVEAYFDMNN